MICSYEIDIAVNPIFEGTSGRDHLNLQRKFRGDERFKLTEDFVSDDDNDDNPKDTVNNSPTAQIDDEEATKTLEEERAGQFDILKEMFGNNIRLEKQKSKKYVINLYYLRLTYINLHQICI